jgi:glycosyltransferase involved in cell wall biosynthesis
MEAGVTVVICTHNGAALLPETLRHLAQQKVRPEIGWEVIVVNNASTDSTAEVVAREWKKHKASVPFYLLYQPEPGLTFAREMALNQARYEFVLFCDDDNWLNDQYINLAYDIMVNNPAIGVLGGYGELVFECTPPFWSLAEKLIANGPQANTSGKVKENVVYGAGCILRRAAFNKLIRAGFTSLLTDRKGASLSSGGDYELCFAIALAGYEIWYDDRLRFKHFTPARRLTWDYHLRYLTESTQSFEALIPYRILVNMNCRNSMLFSLKVSYVYLSYIKKLVPTFITSLVPFTAEEIPINLLKIISLKAKLRTFRNNLAMRNNFRRILAFQRSISNR